MGQKYSRAVAVTAAFFSGATVATGFAAGCRDAAKEASHASPPKVTDTAVEDAGLETAPPQPVLIYEPSTSSFARLVEQVKDAVVNIRTNRKVKGGPASIYPNAPLDESLGSGFVVRADGLVLTGLQIVANVRELRVATADGEEYPAAIIGSDPHLEIALLQVEGLPAKTPTLSLDSAESLQIGEWVLAVGSPFAGEITAYPGVITGVGKRRELSNPPDQKLRGYLQTSATIHVGNAGGPLIDLGGSVVGVNYAATPRASWIGFAVPSSEIAQIFDRLKKGGTLQRAWLGLRFLPVNRARARTAGLDRPRGVLISKVFPSQPAERAGLKRGDIIVQFNDRDVTADNLPGLLHRAGPDRKVPVVVWRDRSEITLEVQTGHMQQ